MHFPFNLFVYLVFQHFLSKNFWLFVTVLLWCALAVDERCDMELDETDPAVWQKLEGCVGEYIQNNSESIKTACERLVLPYQHEDKLSENLKSHQFPKKRTSAGGMFLVSYDGLHLGFKHLETPFTGYEFF